MSGARWSDERKAAFSAAMRKRWASGQYKHRRPSVNSPAGRAKASARMKMLNIRMSWDGELKRKCVNGAKRARRDPAYREIAAAVMRELMSRPDMKELARARCVKRNKSEKMRKAVRHRHRQKREPA